MIERLTMDDEGVYWITTRDSQHLLNLDTTEYVRFRGSNGNHMIDTDGEFFDSFEPFGIGDNMQLIMARGPYSWRVSSPVEKIEPFTGNIGDHLDHSR